MEKTPKNILGALSTGPIQRYIREHESDDVKQLVLKHKAILGIPAAHLFEQIAARKKAREKLPLYYNTEGIIFPPLLNFEQSSSEATAVYKSDIVKGVLHGKTAADLTGGFGVDSYFLSRNLQTVDYVEPEEFLLEIARHNHQLLGASNIRYHLSTAEEFLRQNGESFDAVYLDPSRRDVSKRKIHSLAESRPDVLKLKHQIFGKTKFLLVKASPLFDLHEGIKQLGQIRKVYVISVANECKEVLFLSERDFAGTPVIDAINLTGTAHSFEFTFPEERDVQVLYSDPLKYLYEPNASILKAGAFKSVARRFGLMKLQANTHLYTANDLIPEFPGRKFLIEKLVKPDEVKKYFPEKRGNITVRNYPLTAEQLKKKTGLKDGGEKFLIGFSGATQKFLAVAARV
ncbi:MAG TPA: hypothetical protein VF490_19390 [Chryseosolibacter sp.]